jgi:capsular exopolysaccharide synthesis family protein
MNQTNPDPIYGTTENGSHSFSVQDYLSTLLRGRKVILSCLGVALAASVINTITSKTVYESTALVLLNIRQLGTPYSISESQRNPTENKIANELGELKTTSMAESVARKLLQEPYLDETKTDLLPIVQVKNATKDTLNRIATLTQVAFRAQKSLEFTPERESDVIQITARSTNPREAAKLANTYADVYQEFSVSSSRSHSTSRREFLQDQLIAKRRTLDSIETVLKQYMESSGVVSLDAEATRVTAQLSQLEANRDAIDIDLDALQKTLQTYQERLPQQEKEFVRVMKQANDPYIKLIQEQLAALQVQRDVLSNPSNSGAAKEAYAEKLKSIENQISNLQKKLDDRTVTYLQTLPAGETGAAQSDPAGYLVQAKQKIFETQMQIQALEAKKSALGNVIHQYESDFGGIPRKSIELAKLKRTQISAEKLYLLVEERYNDAAIGEKSDFGYVDIIDKAVVPSSPVSPNVPFNLLLGLFLGLGVGVTFVFLREYLDVRVNTPEDLKRRGYPLLSFVGRTSAADGKGKGYSRAGGGISGAVARMKNESASTPAPSLPRKAVFEGKEYDRTLVSLLEPFSPAGESYRRVRARLEFALSEDRTRKVVVTSPNPGEGKSTTVANLGFAFAQSERRVLIVDSDLRRPVIHSMFGFDLSPGLSEVLTGKATLQNAVHKRIIPGLDVLCAGELMTTDPEILGSKHMMTFLKELNQHYEWVLIDTSPILAVSDAANLTALVDGAVLVVSGGETRLLALDRAIEFLGGAGGKLVGIVLNKFDPREVYGGFYGSDKYGHYGAAYGNVRPSNGGGKDVKQTA